MAERNLCDYCKAPVDVHQGKKTGIAWYNCAACGLRANFRPGTRGFAELAAAGLVEEWD